MMEAVRTLVNASWLDSAREHAREAPVTTLGLGLALLAVLLLFGQSMHRIASGEMEGVVRYALLGGLAGFVATALGAVPALVLRTIPQKLEDSMLGMAAGMMLAASAFSLILPGRVHAGPVCRWNYARSKRSRFITLVQAATKSLTNLPLPSALA